MSKLLLLAAAGAGYVLGTRAGRERYEQIKSVAGRVSQSPTVRDAASQAQATVREQVSSRMPGQHANDDRVPAYSRESENDDLKPRHVP